MGRLQELGVGIYHPGSEVSPDDLPACSDITRFPCCPFLSCTMSPLARKHASALMLQTKCKTEGQNFYFRVVCKPGVGGKEWGPYVSSPVA